MQTNDKGLTSETAAEALGVPYRTLMSWVESGLLEPDRVIGQYKPGHKRPERRWSRKHLREARVFIDLRRRGVPLKTIRKAMDYLRSLGHNPFSTGKFLVIGDPHKPGSVIKICDSGEVLDLVARGQLVLPLAPDEPEQEADGKTETSAAV